MLKNLDVDLRKIRLEVEKIGAELLTALQGANQLINAPEVQA